MWQLKGHAFAQDALNCRSTAYFATAGNSPSAQTVRQSFAAFRLELQYFGHIRSWYASVQLLV